MNKKPIIMPLLELRITRRRPVCRYPELQTRTWLAGRVAAGLTDAAIAMEIAATPAAVREARRRYKLGSYAEQIDRTTTARQRIRERQEQR